MGRSRQTRAQGQRQSLRGGGNRRLVLQAVLWAVENGITSGMDATHFAPNDTCLREQVVTFLYAAAGRPATTAAVNFSDVQPGAWYYAPVAWAVENRITSGMGDGTFGVGATCTRAQIVTFLYAAQK